MPQPRVTDNDKGEITVALDGRELRQKMVQARKYVEGWCDGRDEATHG